MAPNDHLLENICREEETLIQARAILRQAQQKTGPGSGHELGPHTTGLAAICAHIATQRLNNNDVTRKNAQIASCLKASDFEKAFHIVQAAIGGSRRKTGNSGSYGTLVQKYGPPERERLPGWIRAAERAILQTDGRFSTEDPTLRYAIFFWVCGAITGKNIATPQSFAEENEITPKTFNKILAKLSNCCTSLKTRIQDEMKPKHASPTKSSMTPRRPKPVLRALPSRDSPLKRKAETSHSRLEKTDSDVDMLDALAPTKKRKVGSSVDQTLSANCSHAPTASSSRVTLDAGDDDHLTYKAALSPRKPAPRPASPIAPVPDMDHAADLAPSSEESDMEALQTSRRFRPVYHDFQQWYNHDERQRLVQNWAESRKSGMIELHGHPFEQYRPELMLS